MRKYYSTLLMLLVCVTAGCEAAGGWKGKQAEVYFVVDGTSSMWKSEFQLQLSLVADLVSDMDIGPNRTRVGMGVYADRFDPVIPLSNTFDKQTLLSKIRDTEHIRGQTDMSKGLQGMRDALAPSHTRPFAPRIGVLLTDGHSSLYSLSQTYNNASHARREGIFLFVVGIGSRVKDLELRDLSSDPKRQFLFKEKNFTLLWRIKRSLSYNMAKVSLYQDDNGTCGQTAKVDTVFVYDEFNLGLDLRNSVHKFLNTVANDLRINPGNVRVGVVSDSQPGAGNSVHLGDYILREEFKQALERKTSKKGIDELLRHAREKYFITSAGHRIDAKKRLVLILNEPVPKGSLLRSGLAEQLYRARFMDDMEVYIIRPGSNYDKEYLQRLASTPQHVLFTDIDSAIGPFLQLFCKDI
ncbi:hypothetical protein RRG08_007128 [Elysia crispata]|uniref:VWFA domain-containing protein n=1 Tax=Elysia crispata TaxID=231223 RepID=A0AAE0Y7C7_9GAST|nr:hypothetical protein RRG08_007128 [Elysia crispata]